MLGSIKKNYILKIKLVNALKSISQLSRHNNKIEILFWIFLDSDRINNYQQFLNAIPVNKKIGVILRAKNNNNIYYLSKSLKKICRKKKFKFLISDSQILAMSVGADGIHYSRNRNFSRSIKKKIISCSCHGYKDKRRINNLNAKLTFISPVFLTYSGQNKKPLGLIKISLLANYLNNQYSILGGVNSSNINSLRNRGIKSVAGLDYISSLIK